MPYEWGPDFVAPRQSFREGLSPRQSLAALTPDDSASPFGGHKFGMLSLPAFPIVESLLGEASLQKIASQLNLEPISSTILLQGSEAALL